MQLKLAQPVPFTEEELEKARSFKERLIHVLPDELQSDFVVARFYRAYKGDAVEAEQRIREILAHRQAFGYNSTNVLDISKELDFIMNIFDFFAISRLRTDVWSEDVLVFLQRMKGVDLKEILKVIPASSVVHAYFILQTNFQRAIMEHERRTGRPAAAIIIIDLEGLILRDFINPFSAPSQLARLIGKIWSDYFSENLMRVYLVNPPGILSLMWQITKHILDARTLSRIVILPNAEDLKEHLLSEAIPEDYGGARRDDTGFAKTPGSCVSAPYIVSPEDYFLPERFWHEHGISKPFPAYKTVTLKVKGIQEVNIECKAGQKIVWMFEVSSDITFEIVFLPTANGTPSTQKELSVWPKVTIRSLHIPEHGFLKCPHSGNYIARFSNASTSMAWILTAPKLSYVICKK